MSCAQIGIHMSEAAAADCFSPVLLHSHCLQTPNISPSDWKQESQLPVGKIMHMGLPFQLYVGFNHNSVRSCTAALFNLFT